MKTIAAVRKTSALVPLLIALILGSSAFAQSTNFTFDTSTVGLPPAGWTVGVQPSAGATVAVTSAQFVSPSNSLEIRDMGDYTLGGGYMYKLGLGSAYLPYHSNDLFTFDVRFSTNTANQFRFQLWNSGFAAYGSYMNVLVNNGQVKAQYGTSSLLETNLGVTIIPNVWYSFRVNVTPVSNYYGLSVVSNGTVLGQVDHLALNSDVPDGAIFINDGWVNIGQTGQSSVFIDNIFFGAIPEPSGIALVGLGALGIALCKRRVRR